MPYTRSIVHFDTFSFDLESGHLTMGEHRIRLPEQNVRLLSYLIEKSGRLVGREELRRNLWPGGAPYNFEQAINKAISQLRSALQDNATSPRYIETFPQRGYRFCADVQYEEVTLNLVTPPEPDLTAVATLPTLATVSSPVSAPAAGSLPMSTLAYPSQPANTIVRAPATLALLTASIAAMALIVVGLLAHRRNNAQIVSHPPVSVGVAPFELTGANGHELATSLRLELIDGLAASPQTRVIAATSTGSLKADSTLPSEAARLGLDIVIFGHVEVSSDTFHLTLELVHAADQAHITTLSYFGLKRNLLDTQNHVMQDVFHVLQIKRSGHDDPGKTSKPEAYDAYLHGTFDYLKFTTEGAEQSSIEFKQATQLDPNYGEAWSALAKSYMFEAERFNPYAADTKRREFYQLAGDAIEQALRVSPDLSAAHRAFANLLIVQGWKFDEGLREAKIAVRLTPGSSEANGSLGWALAFTGHYAEAARQIGIARTLDPFNPRIDMNESYADFGSGDCSRILTMAHKVLGDMPSSVVANNMAARSFWYCGSHEEAIATWRKAAVLSNDPLWISREDEGLKAWRAGGDKAYALTRTAAAEQDDRAQRFNFYNEEEWNAIAGRTPKAVALMKKEFTERNPQFLLDCMLPSLANVRKQPEIHSLIAQIY